MRSIFLALVLFTACAAQPKHVNVAYVRRDINEVIKADGPDRSIYSMGKVTEERAVIYTTKPDGSRQEETWAKTAGVWKLENATAVAGAGATTDAN
jgi:hypothetical protein